MKRNSREPPVHVRATTVVARKRNRDRVSVSRGALPSGSYHRFRPSAVRGEIAEHRAQRWAEQSAERAECSSGRVQISTKRRAL